MFAGPIFSREALTAPRQPRHYLIRAGYVASLLILFYTAGQATFGWQQVRNISDISRFGAFIFQILSIVQLTLVLFFGLLFAAGSVAQEKDRKTLVLLLMTDLRNQELVLGKLFASMLIVAVLLVASVPVFALTYMLGGISLEQIGWSLMLCAATTFAAGSWGTLVAFSREKTFQTLAVSVLGVVAYLAICSGAGYALGSETSLGAIVASLNPYAALAGVLDPFRDVGAAGSTLTSVAALVLLGVVMNGVVIARLRIWNPPRVVHGAPSEEREESDGAARTTHRAVWDLPILWREMRTRAYGRKIVIIKLAYLLFAAAGFLYIQNLPMDDGRVLGMISTTGAVFVGVTLLSLMLINAQSVTALTSERDGQTLELLLVTDVTAKEFIFGKLGGILYNTKELILVPVLLVGYLVGRGSLTGEEAVYLVIGFLTLVFFASMLGLHAGLTYFSSKSAIANSLGTMFFLFVGIFIFMMLLVEASGSFGVQVQSFLVFIGAGTIALYSSLTHRNPSHALTIGAFVLPFLTFYSITEFLLEGTLGVCMAIVLAYGFTGIAMLIPAVSEFDVVLGRSAMEND